MPQNVAIRSRLKHTSVLVCQVGHPETYWPRARHLSPVLLPLQFVRGADSFVIGSRSNNQRTELPLFPLSARHSTDFIIP
jgi:hypothetical protein